MKHALLIVWASILMATTAWSQGPRERAFAFNLTAQPLEDALNLMAVQSSLHIVFNSEDARGVTTERIAGTYTPQEALRKLLAGTDLSYRFVDEKTVEIRVEKRPIAAIEGQEIAGSLRLAQNDTPSPQVTEESSSDKSLDSSRAREQEEVEVVEQIIIRGARTSTATKMNASILEVPQNIQVLSSRFIDDIGAVHLEDALRHVAGVSVGNWYQGYDFFRIRGFNGTSYLDGMRIDSVNLSGEVFGLERIEVLKGPSSVLYGGGLLSGMVNLVSKRPKRGAFFEAAFTGGEHDYVEASVDFGGSLNRSQSVRARMPVLYREDGSFVDFVDGLKRLYVAPSIAWDMGENTQLVVLSAYQKDRNELAFALPGVGTVLPNPNGRIPLTRFIGDGNDPGVTHDESWEIGYQFTHSFGEAFSFRQNVRQHHRKTSWDRLMYASFLLPDLRTLERLPFYLDDLVDRDFTADTGIELQFATGAIRHHMTAGIDYSYQTLHQIERGDYGGGHPIDLFDPVEDGASTVNELFVSFYSEKQQSLGFYLQDQLRLGDRLSVMIGGRYEQVDGGNALTTDPDDAQLIGGSAFVPSIGASYELAPGLHAYASYSEAFKGQFASRVAGGRKADPEEGVQYEVGVKAGLFENRVNGTLSAYELTRRNVLQPDALNPGFSTLTGEQRSRGIEFDGQFLVRENWEIVADLAYTDAEITEDVDIPAGSPLRNVPKAAIGLWSKYSFRTGVLKGLAVSLGGSYYDRQQGKDVSAPTPDSTDIESFYLPSYTLIGANLNYPLGKARIGLTFSNLLNERYFSGSFNEFFVLPGEPRSVRLTASWSM